jgi:hypothetical protein
VSIALAVGASCFRDSQTKRLADTLKRIDLKKVAWLLQRLNIATRPDRQRAVAAHGLRGETEYYEERLQWLLLGATDAGNDESPVTRERDKERFEDADPFMASLLAEEDRRRADRVQPRRR